MQHSRLLALPYTRLGVAKIYPQLLSIEGAAYEETTSIVICTDTILNRKDTSNALPHSKHTDTGACMSIITIQ